MYNTKSMSYSVSKRNLIAIQTHIFRKSNFHTLMLFVYTLWGSGTRIPDTDTDADTDTDIDTDADADTDTDTDVNVLFNK